MMHEAGDGKNLFEILKILSICNNNIIQDHNPRPKRTNM